MLPNKATLENLKKWLKNRFEEAGKQIAVLGLSGGIDSAVVAALCAEALGPVNVKACLLPCDSQEADRKDAGRIADFLNLKPQIIDLTSVYRDFLKILPKGSRLADANIKPRLRMTVLYHRAQALDGLVVGTGNKSEIAVGYFTKYGDGAADLLPLALFTKTQVRHLAGLLNLPDWVMERTPSAGLWENQSDESEMGFSYSELDDTIEKLAKGKETEVEQSLLECIQQKIEASGHKKAAPPVFDPMLP